MEWKYLKSELLERKLAIKTKKPKLILILIQKLTASYYEHYMKSKTWIMAILKSANFLPNTFFSACHPEL